MVAALGIARKIRLLQLPWCLMLFSGGGTATLVCFNVLAALVYDLVLLALFSSTLQRCPDQPLLWVFVLLGTSVVLEVPGR